ncbi:hypothetical protein ACFQZZ_04235 [Nocardia sp. GCM10030253]|uniref:hypothetical protein n=1 Tax=Nocardia sp. GCM10030253 TaxID=3273404 RepID=UPI003632D009
MSISLTSANGSLNVNAWTWGPLHALVAEAGIFADDDWEPTRYNGGTELDHHQVEALANFLQQEILPRLADGERLRTDGTVTAEPDDGTFHRDDLSLNYSIHREMLVQIIEFLCAASGPVSFD